MSKETEDERSAEPAELYDFLYRDPERIASYYAQIWNGRLVSVEETSSEREQSDESLTGSVQLLSTESKQTAEFQSQNKRTIDMHDAATVDLLLRLAAKRAEDGVLGSIRVFSGTCFFLDRNILKYAGPAIDLTFQQEQTAKNRSSETRQQRRYAQRQSGKRDAYDDKGIATIKQLISTIDMPSGFILKIGEHAVCGSIKESGLDQPISSLLFRAGNFGLANTFVVGLVEEMGLAHFPSLSPIHQAQTQMADAFLPLLFPADAVRMVPLAIYRKIKL